MITSRILRVDPSALLAPIQETGSLDSLMEVQTRVVWNLLSKNDRTFTLSLADFSKLQRPLRLDAFEHYIRGVLAPEDEPRLRELREAARLEPAWPEPEFALGETYAARNDCESAIPWFARVPKSHQHYIEAIFATGVCRLQMNQPEKAEEVFSSLQGNLPKDATSATQTSEAGSGNEGASVVSGADLPAILNNLAIAKERDGKNAAAQNDLRRASELDPDEDDYQFNLGLLEFRNKDFSAAADYFREASQREPDSAEDRGLLIQSLEKAGKGTEADQERDAAGEALGPSAVTAIRTDGKGDALARLDRIRTKLDTTALRLEVEAPDSGPQTTADASTTAETPTAQIRRGRRELSSGHLDAAESEFRKALSAEPENSAAHREMAEVYRRRNKLDDAVKELQASIAERDSAAARTALAKIYLEQKKSDLARTEAERALKLAPNYAEAKQLLANLQNARPKGAAQ
jgi:tetratricopeptide (TPR) repeat protein